MTFAASRVALMGSLRLCLAINEPNGQGVPGPSSWTTLLVNVTAAPLSMTLSWFDSCLSLPWAQFCLQHINCATGSLWPSLLDTVLDATCGQPLRPPNNSLLPRVIGNIPIPGHAKAPALPAVHYAHKRKLIAEADRPATPLAAMRCRLRIPQPRSWGAVRIQHLRKSPRPPRRPRDLRL